jgi:paraquat-inducible protein B
MNVSAKSSIAPAVVGGFVLGGTLLVVAAIVLFGNLRLFSPTISASVVFTGSVAGLSIGAPVTFRGVNVGSVVDITIEFEPKTHIAYIPVQITLEPDHVKIAHDGSSGPARLSTMIARGLRAELHTQSIVTGQSGIDLDFDIASPATLHPDMAKFPEIPTRQSPMDKIENAITSLPLHELADNANATLKSLRSLSGKLNTDVPSLIASVKSTSDRASGAIDTMVQTVKDLQGKLTITLASITTLATTGTSVLDRRSVELHTLLVSANQDVLQAGDVLGNLKGLTSSRSAARVNIESTLSDLAASAAALRGLTNDVEHNPQLLLTGRRP